MQKTILSAVLLICTLMVSSIGFAQDQKSIDDKILTDYFAKNKIKASKTASGLYYVIHKQGSGENARAGQKVSMKYFGKFLDGRKFDANMDENYTCANPLVFTLGIGQVIKGWDEGIQLLNPGTRASLYIPSAIGYGPSGRGPIPPNTIMVFDVELVSAAK